MASGNRDPNLALSNSTVTARSKRTSNELTPVNRNRTGISLLFVFRNRPTRAFSLRSWLALFLFRDQFAFIGFRLRRQPGLWAGNLAGKRCSHILSYPLVVPSSPETARQDNAQLHDALHLICLTLVALWIAGLKVMVEFAIVLLYTARPIYVVCSASMHRTPSHAGAAGGAPSGSRSTI